LARDLVVLLPQYSVLIFIEPRAATATAVLHWAIERYTATAVNTYYFKKMGNDKALQPRLEHSRIFNAPSNISTKMHSKDAEHSKVVEH